MSARRSSRGLISRGASTASRQRRALRHRRVLLDVPRKALRLSSGSSSPCRRCGACPSARQVQRLANARATPPRCRVACCCSTPSRMAWRSPPVCWVDVRDPAVTALAGRVIAVEKLTGLSSGRDSALREAAGSGLDGDARACMTVSATPCQRRVRVAAVRRASKPGDGWVARAPTGVWRRTVRGLVDSR